jgi:hypothetical protein
MDDERWQKFLQIVRETGSFKYACKVASAHLKNPSGDSGQSYGVGSFNALLKRDPMKRAEYEAALSDGIAELEKIAHDRIKMPDRKPVLNKAGEIVGYSENWFAANQLLTRSLERHDNAWAQKKNISGQITNINIDGNETAAPGYLIKLSDVECLSDEQRKQLGEILRAVETHRLGFDGEVVEQQPMLAGEVVETPALPAPASIAPTATEQA